MVLFYSQQALTYSSDMLELEYINLANIEFTDISTL